MTKIAIHGRKDSFSESWIEYCKRNNINYKIVNCYDSNIIADINDCSVLLWHHSHGSYKDKLFAKELLFSLQQSGKIVFPNFYTGWHFDDKIGQKYLLESINAPLIPTYIFYDKTEALSWIKSTAYPKVFKLRCGAGAMNVKLVNNQFEAKKLINQAFNNGFKKTDRLYNFEVELKKYKKNEVGFINIIKAFVRLFIPTNFEKYISREKGYVYFQEFIPGNNYDVRLIVIKDKAYGMKRMVRNNDFRASGSGIFNYDKIGKETLKIAFEVAEKLKLDSVAFDFIYDKEGNPLIVEISCFYGTKGSSKCSGYWDRNYVWHEVSFNPQEWILENILSTHH